MHAFMYGIQGKNSSYVLIANVMHFHGYCDGKHTRTHVQLSFENDWFPFPTNTRMTMLICIKCSSLVRNQPSVLQVRDDVPNNRQFESKFYSRRLRFDVHS